MCGFPGGRVIRGESVSSSDREVTGDVRSASRLIQGDGMVSLRFFHEIDGDVHELPDGGPFPYERGLQEFFEKHLCTLTGVDFLDSEYSTGQQHGRRIDTLGIDGSGRPVVVEYKRRRDENVINQGLDYLAWLEDHGAEFRELVREKLGDWSRRENRLWNAATTVHRSRVPASGSDRRAKQPSTRRPAELPPVRRCLCGVGVGLRRRGDRTRAAARP